MEVNSQFRLASMNISPKRRRAPLISSTNSFTQTYNPSISKKLRRKLSNVYRIDSSEELPTSHESIFQAECLSNHESEDSSPKHESWPTAAPADAGNDENNRAQFLSPAVGNTPILYGHGTALQTIVEQKSTSIISTTSRNRSVSDNSTPIVSTPKLLDHCDSFCLPSTVTLRSPCRRKSFSADDLVFIKRSYHEACAMIERTTRRSIHIEQIYAEPRTPLMPPIQRPPTPPGLPSWTAAQITPMHSQPLRRSWAIRRGANRLQRLLGIEHNPIEFPSCITLPSMTRQSGQSMQPARRSASNPLPRRVPPRFRPVRSGHGQGPLEEHPFLRASAVTADVKGVVPAAAPWVNQTNETLLPQRISSLVQSTNLAANTAQAPHVRVMASGGGHGKRTQCPHRRGRIASLRSLNNRSEAANTRTGAMRQPITSPSMMTPRTQPGTLAGKRLAKSIPQTPRCWKCRASALASQADDIWSDATQWCCWIFCGVQLNDCDDDRNARPHSHMLGRHGDGDVALVPRGRVPDSVPVMMS